MCSPNPNSYSLLCCQLVFQKGKGKATIEDLDSDHGAEPKEVIDNQEDDSKGPKTKLTQKQKKKQKKDVSHNN